MTENMVVEAAAMDDVDPALRRRRLQVPSERLRGMSRDLPAVAGAGPVRQVTVQVARTSKNPRRGMRRTLHDTNPVTIAAGSSIVPLLVVGTVTLLQGADQQALITLIPQMRQTLGYDLQFLLLFGTAVSVVYQMSAPLMGYLADRLPRIWMMRAGGLITHLAAMSIGFATTPLALLALRGVTGLGTNMDGAAKSPLLADSYPPTTRGRVFAFTLQFGTIGNILSPLVVGVIAVNFGWRAAFISLGAFASVVVLLYFLVREPVRGEQDRLAMGADAQTAAVAQPPMRFSESLRAASSVRTLKRFWWASIFLGGGALSIFLVIIFLVDAWHVTPLGIGLIASGNSVAALLAQASSGPIVDRLLAERPGRVMYFIASMGLLCCAGVALTAFAPVFWMAVAGSFLLSAGQALVSTQFSPAITAVASLTIPARVRGLGMQSLIPFGLVGALLVIGGVGQLTSMGAGQREQLLGYIPFYVVGCAILASAAGGVRHDIRAALASSMAEDAARQARLAGTNRLLVCRDIDVVYDNGARALFGVDLDVEEGEILALLGTNGSGKSTLLRVIAGLQVASSGAVLYDGLDVTHSPPHHNAGRGVVMVPGGRAVFPTLTVAENLRAAERVAPGPPAELAARVEHVHTLFPVLRDRRRQRAGDLSGGEQQMLALAQAFLMKPRLLMVDELTLGLAPQVVEVLLEALRGIHRAGTTVILVEQSVNLALTIADRVVFMEKGQVTYNGPSADLLKRPDVVHSTFLGGTAGGAIVRSRAARPALDDPAGALLQVRGLGVKYGGVQALADVSLEIMPGDIVGFIGPNGAGKTTLFDVISGFLKPDVGSITFVDADVTGRGPDERARMGLVRSFQDVRLFSALTVRENILVAFERHLPIRSAALGAIYLPVREGELRIRRRTEILISSLGLGPLADKFISELSTGSRRIVDLACLLAAEPRLLLLDEPSSGLAQAETEELGPLIARIAREVGCAIMVVEHDIPLVSAVSTRLVAMATGRVIAQGPADAVMADPEVIRAYLGASREVLARSGLAMAAAPAS